MTRKTTTSTEVKARWNNEHYSRLVLYLEKAEAETYREKCAHDGISLSDIPKQAISEYLSKK